MTMVLNLRYAARSDVGLVRADNEDSGYAGSRMLVVADGMGGHAAGELASATAVATFASLDVGQELQPGDDEILGLLAAAVDDAHDALHAVASNAPESRGMGTTLTAMAWLNDRVALAHIGDSRGYLFRDQVLTQLTRDHTYVQTLVDAGRITPAEAMTHERRNLLMKALDGFHEVDSDLSILQVRPGDRFLLSTDGLHGVVDDQRLANILAEYSDPTGAVTALVEEALRDGAPDNVTALVADVVEVPGADATIQYSPIVVGAAAEQRNRARLPGVAFPGDVEPTSEPLDGAGESATNADAPARQLGLDSPTPMAKGELPGEANSGRKRRLRLGNTWMILAITAVVLVGATLLGWWWTRSQYFVGDYNGRVAVFQGIPQGPGANGLATTQSVSDTYVVDLPTFERGQVQSTIGASSAVEALAIVATLSKKAEECRKVPAPSGCPVSTAPVPSPSPSASTSGSGSPSPSPTGSAAGGSGSPAPAATTQAPAAATPAAQGEPAPITDGAGADA